MIRSVMAGLLVCGTVTQALAQSQSAPAAPAPTPAPVAPAAAAAPAAAPEIKRLKLGALLSQGYEIKAVTLVPQGVTSRLAGSPDRDGVLVTMQKGSTAATCLFSLADYTKPGLLDIVWCIEQN